jgi:alpha-mannosidase
MIGVRRPRSFYTQLPLPSQMRYMLKFRKCCVATLIILSGNCSSPNASANPPTGEADRFYWQVGSFYMRKADSQAGRVVFFKLKDDAYKGPVSVNITCNNVTENTAFKITNPSSWFFLLLPADAGVDTATTAALSVNYGAETSAATIPISRLKQWTVYIYPHSHLDIGYTGLPADVQKLQVRNIDVGIDLARKTQSYPEGARFIWNPEATWTVINYLKTATPVQKQQFIDAVGKGWVQIDGGHSNINTSTCSDEELLRFFSNSAAIEKVTGVPVTTMVQIDVPGAAWGLVTAAAQHGIKGMISFPNNYDVRKQFEHKPFYWLAPDGKTKMLFLQGFPYGIGYTIKGSKYGLAKLQHYSNEYDRVSTNNPSEHFLNPFLFEEIDELEKINSPYDIFAMTWSMADNCVIDADLPDAVKAWNEMYAYPKLVIAGAKQILDAYEKKYASIIPQYHGDFTEFWTNGLGSDAASVGKGRIAKENLAQAEILWSILQPAAKYPSAQFDMAWENNLLSAEHTWGAQDSKSLLAQQVEQLKASYFSDAEQQSKALINEAVASYKDTLSPGFSVINTLSWQRDAIVTLTAKQSTTGDRVMDDRNHAVPSQRLSTGELIFLAQQVPGLGSKFYTVVAGKPEWKTNLSVSSSGLQNDFISLQLDSNTGRISSVKTLSNGYEYVDAKIGLNSYQYMPGVYNGKDQPRPLTTASHVSVSIKEKGPLLVSLAITATADGVNSLNSEIRLYKNAPSVEVVNLLDKISTRNKEGVHFGFGFHLPGATNRLEMPWSIVTPNTDQLSGANKNWFTIQRWVDISNNDHGITWSAIESPLVECSQPGGNILDGARQPWLWYKDVALSATIYSWPLNNHWDTNFPLEQGGTIKQTYAFTFHNKYDVVAANRFGLETHRPLIVVQTKKNIIEKPLLHINNPKVVISTLRRTSANNILMRLKSVSGKTEVIRFTWPAATPTKISECDINEVPKQTIGDTFQIEPYGMASLKLVF